MSQRKHFETSEDTAYRYTETPAAATYRFVVNHHKHPEVGGTGHVSLHAQRGDERFELNMHPKPDSVLPHHVLSAYAFPLPAITKPIKQHHETPTEGDSPLTSSYHIPADMIPDPEAAIREIQRINAGIESRHIGFSIVPSIVTHAFHALTSSHVSLYNVHTAMKSGDREQVQAELDKVEVSNCAASLGSVLVKGGLNVPRQYGYHTPSGIHGFFKARLPNMYNAQTPAIGQPHSTHQRENKR
jgi:hypothetical protein